MTRLLTYALPLGICAYVALAVEHGAFAVVVCALVVAAFAFIAWCVRDQDVPERPDWRDQP